MKQKLPEKSSYKNLYLGKARKTKILSNSWAKYSLIGLLITKLFNKKTFVNSLDFQMISILINLCYSKKNENFILKNSLMLFILPVFFCTYRSSIARIVEINNFTLTKVDRQNNLSENYIKIYKRSLRDLNKNLDIFLRNTFRKRNPKLSRYESPNIITRFNDPIFFGEIHESFEKEKNDLIYNLDFSKNFLDYYLFTKGRKNSDYLWARKQILRNLRNWGESTESLIKSSFLLKEKENLYLSNYIKVHLWQFFTNTERQWYWDIVEPKIFTERKRTLKYCYSQLNNSKLCIILESILSDAIYKFSKYLVYKATKSNIQIRNTNFSTEEINKDIHFFDSILNIDRTLQRDLHFIYFSPFHHLYTENSHFDWMNRMLYLKYEANSLKLLFLKRTFLNKSLSSLKNEPDLHFEFSGKFLSGKYMINYLFSEQKGKKINPNLFFFLKSLVINESGQNTTSKQIFTGFYKKLKNNIESDDIEIILSNPRKFYSNFLRNYSLPFNFTYHIIHKNYSFNRRIHYEVKKSNRLLVEISNLSSFFSTLKKTFSLIRCIELKEHLIIKTNELDIVIDQSNENKDSNFIKKILVIFGKNDGAYNNKNELINHYDSSLKKLLETTPSFKVWDSRRIYKDKIFQQYSISWKKLSFFYNFGNDRYKKLGFGLYHSIDEMKNSSKKVVPHKFLRKLNLIKLLKQYIQNPGSKNIHKISNSLEISTNIRNIYVNQNTLLTRIFIKNFEFSDPNMNNLVIDSFINKIKNEEILIYLLNAFFMKNHIFLNWIKNEKLFSNYNLNFDELLINIELNYKKNFLFYSEENPVENNRILYLQLLKNLSKYNKLNDIFTEKRSLFILNKFLVFQIFNNGDKTKFVSFYDFYKEISEQTNLYFSTNSKTIFSGRNRDPFKALLTNRKLETNKMGTEILTDLNNMEIKKYYNILQSESFSKHIGINNLGFQSINEIYLSPIVKYSKMKDLKKEIRKKILKQTDQVYDRSHKIDIFPFFQRDSSFKDKNYTYWFFTSEWWKYNINILGKILQKHFVLISSYFEYFINNNIQFIQKNLTNLYEKKKKLYTFNSRWHSRLFCDYTQENIFNFLWSDLQLINNLNTLHWAIFSLILLVFLSYKNSFSIFIGSDSIDLWKHFENIKYLTDTSRAYYFTELSHRSKTQLNKTENFLVYFLSNLKHYVKNIRFYLLTKKELDNWLVNNKSLDLSRRKRNLIVQCLITPVRIKEYGFQSYSQSKIPNNLLFGYHRNTQQGLSYIRYLSGMFKKNLVNYSLYLADKWIFFASLQKIISSQTLQQTKKFNPKFQKIPIPLQLGLSCSKGILLIGPIESGRSYLIKNLAADCSVPLLVISIDKLMYNKPDIITESWMNILIESLRRLNLILDLAKGMSPCIIWIRNIHELDVDRSTQNIESDPTFLLGILLKHFQNNSSKTQTKNNIVMIGSTHIPKKVDPSLISPDRLDRVLNIRLLNTYQRKDQFPILLNKNNLQLRKNLLYFNEFGYRTMGYNIRDLVALTNEISLISITNNESFVYDDIIKLAFHRQILGFSYTSNKPNYKQNFKILLYKAGRTVIQNIMIEGSTTDPLNISNYLSKRKFYYLSKWYSEPSIADSIIKESTILVNVLGCLAGIAARDSWFLLEKDTHTSISLEKSVENDLSLAFSILETFSSDFSWLETCENQFLNYRKKQPKIFLAKNSLNIMHSGIFAIANKRIINPQTDSQYESLFSRNEILNKKICKFGNTAWSPRFWRLSFYRSHLFNWIKRPNDFGSFHTLGFLGKKNLEKKNQNEQLFYERILPRVRKRNVEELESQFENILLEEQFEILGFFGSSTQYQMEYQLDTKPRFFIGKRILWDPIGSFSQNRDFIFSRREFFVDEEMLRRLYITYGVRRERERSLSSHRIKRFFICRGYNKDLINKLSVRWWNQLPIDQKQNIHTLKRIEKIGTRLKRPQIFTPVYLYQRWLIENIPGKFSRLDLLTHRHRWMKINRSLLNDSFAYNILLESYQYLFEFFLLNKALLTEITKTLLTKKWIFQNEILDIVHNMKNTKFL